MITFNVKHLQHYSGPIHVLTFEVVCILHLVLIYRVCPINFHFVILTLCQCSARVTFVDSASAKRAIDQVSGSMFHDNKITITYAPTDNFLFLGNLALTIDENILWVCAENFRSVKADIL